MSVVSTQICDRCRVTRELGSDSRYKDGWRVLGAKEDEADLCPDCASDIVAQIRQNTATTAPAPKADALDGGDE